MIPFRPDRVQLDNGLRVLFHRTTRIPLVSVSLFVLAGKDQNPLDKPGLASMTARLLDEGTERYTERDLSRIVEGLGGDLSSFSERESTGMCLELHAADLAKGVELLTEMVCRPTFPEPRLSREREKVKNHISSMSDDPQIVGSQRLDYWIYRGTPLEAPSLGTVESLESISRDDLVDFHRRKYGPANTILVAVGDISFDALHRLVEDELGDWENEDLELSRVDTLNLQTHPIIDHQRMQKEQINLFLGHLGIRRLNPDYYTTQVMDTILGGGPGFTSRIPRRLRDEQGLAYMTYADLAGSSGVHPGRFVAFVATAAHNYPFVLEALEREIRQFVEEGPEESELALAKEFLTGNFVFEFQSNATLARFLLMAEIFSLERDYPSFYPDLVLGVTNEQVIQVARRYLDTVNYTTVVVGLV